MPIYERHVELTKLDTALDIGASVNGGRNVRELWRFACEGYLGNFVSQEEEKIAEAETHTVKVDGETIPYRDLRPRIANEEDRARREILERARNESTEEHNGLYIRKHQVVHRETERLGAPNYTELYRGFQYPLDDLADQCRRFLDSTERLWEDAGDRFFRSRIGLGLGEIERWDVARVFRGAGWDDGVSEGPHGAGARGDALRLRRRPARAAQRRARPRGPPEQDAARVLRSDRDSRSRRARDQAAGRPRRLARALPRGRAHRALRAHVRRRSRSKSGGSATTPSPRAGRCCSSTSRSSRRGSICASTSRGRWSSPRKARRSCSGSCAGTARS